MTKIPRRPPTFENHSEPSETARARPPAPSRFGLTSDITAKHYPLLAASVMPVGVRDEAIHPLPVAEIHRRAAISHQVTKNRARATADGGWP